MSGLKGGVAAVGGCLMATVIALAVAAGPARAASTRAEYVVQVDPICQTGFKPEAKAALAYLRSLNKLGSGAQAGKRSKRNFNRYLRATAKFLGVTARVDTSITSQIAAIPPAPGDEATVSAWLQKRIETVSLLDQGIVALKHRKLGAFATLIQQSESTRQAGEAVVAGFGFKYCVPPD